MHREGHIGLALVTYTPLLFLLVAVGLEDLALAGGLGVAGLSMLPDQDQRVPFIEHRGPTHTIRFMLAVAGILALAGLLLGISGGILRAFALGLLGGLVGVVSVGSHIVADALTPAGVEPFGDGRHYSFDVARAANPLANYALFGLGVVGVGVAYVAGVWIAALVP